MERIFSIENANAYIAKNKSKVNKTFKPQAHFSAEVGWINDPNGFVFFRGEYHLFYQYYPYGSSWGMMHWGHAKSLDLVHWEHLPIALAPDKPYDKDGCFSGSAIVKDDVLWLMYTGNVVQEDGTTRQVQNMAYSEDGIHFVKIDENPVATGACLPSELNAENFRDPKLFEKENRFYAVVAAEHQEKVGAIVLLGSDDLKHWEFESVILKGTPEQGIMWECPDYFELNGKDILVISPMRFKKNGYDYCNINASIVLTGKMNWKTKTFHVEHLKEIDHGHDYYAPQTLKDDKGRRICIAWAHTWGRTLPVHDFDHGWAGSMTIPRQLELFNGQVVQKVLPETLSALPELKIGEKIQGAGWVELEVNNTLHLQLGTTDDYVQFGYDQQKKIVYIDRSHLKNVLKGDEAWDVNCRAVCIEAKKLFVIIDCNTIELFVNEGEETLTSTYYIQGDCQLRRVD